MLGVALGENGTYVTASPEQFEEDQRRPHQLLDPIGAFNYKTYETVKLRLKRSRPLSRIQP